ncbi:tetratricopeptide repeat protein [Hymenobacter sp. BRD128]|uniref:tetratricopeptide repeat protein n=1 Tax=Hymenobacter sp. BRD128 TaxID=2675878 RepID=UPI00156339A8|nr:tetratricopeptide repeat protein [Hymenobacter sp. BRD128]QKG57425.1 tetratricopeptide repeat protein [Hymenobacter sp. BRD128]
MAGAVRVGTSPAPGWFAQAQQLVELGRYALAEELVRRELSQHPRSATAQVMLSLILQHTNRAAEAETAARQALALSPQYAEGYYFLALSCWQQRRLPEAGAAIATALELDPLAAKYYGVQSGLQLAWQQPTQALLIADAGLRLDPTNLTCLDYRLQALRVLNEPARAQATARSILRLAPNRAKTHVALGELLLAQAAYAPAEAHFRAALRSEPGLAAARQGLSQVWKQHFWLHRQAERLDSFAQRINEKLVNKIGASAYVLYFAGLVLLMPILCLPLALLYGGAYLRWRLAPAVRVLRSRSRVPDLPWWQLAPIAIGCLGAAALAIFLPASLAAAATAVAPLAAFGFWREVWGEPGPEPERDQVEWF